MPTDPMNPAAGALASPNTHWAHQANLADRLRRIAAGMRPVLLFLAGSWPEWITVRSQRDWGASARTFLRFHPLGDNSDIRRVRQHSGSARAARDAADRPPLYETIGLG